MNILYETDDGFKTENAMMICFIKSIDKLKEYELFKTAITNKKIEFE